MTEESASAPTGGARFTGKTEHKDDIVKALKNVYDPEIPIDIYELGLVYEVDVSEGGAALVRMTLTSPACPAAEQIPIDVKNQVGAVEGIVTADVEIIWDPPWTPEFMSEAARVHLGMF